MINIPESIQVFLEKAQARVYPGPLCWVGALKREPRQCKEGPGLHSLLYQIPRAKHVSSGSIGPKAIPRVCLFIAPGQQTPSQCLPELRKPQSKPHIVCWSKQTQRGRSSCPNSHRMPGQPWDKACAWPSVWSYSLPTALRLLSARPTPSSQPLGSPPGLRVEQRLRSRWQFSNSSSRTSVRPEQLGPQWHGETAVPNFARAQSSLSDPPPPPPPPPPPGPPP